MPGPARKKGTGSWAAGPDRIPPTASGPPRAALWRTQPELKPRPLVGRREPRGKWRHEHPEAWAGFHRLQLDRCGHRRLRHRGLCGDDVLLPVGPGPRTVGMDRARGGCVGLSLAPVHPSGNPSPPLPFLVSDPVPGLDLTSLPVLNPSSSFLSLCLIPSLCDQSESISTVQRPRPSHTLPKIKEQGQGCPSLPRTTLPAARVQDVRGRPSSASPKSQGDDNGHSNDTAGAWGVCVTII